MDLVCENCEEEKRNVGRGELLVRKRTVPARLSKGNMWRTKVGGWTMIRESELQRVIDDGGVSPASKRRGH